MGKNPHNSKGTFADNFDCYICDVINGNPSADVKPMIGEKDHYGCPMPLKFVSEHDLTRQSPEASRYITWMSSYCDVRAMMELSKEGRQSYSKERFKAAARRCLTDGHWKRKNLE